MCLWLVFLLHPKIFDPIKTIHRGALEPRDKFTIPNGMTLRPASDKMLEILKLWRGEPRIYVLKGGMTLPKGLCVYHEHTDHHSLQTTVPIEPEEFYKKLTMLLQDQHSVGKQQMIAMLEDPDDQDN
ncbi:hypothetical protein MIR68_001029 [Amoeboaphelidium protococcarum]|nr:hypothetical protein MIR68_001029 [Amoeboaphelidium protococcarum]